MKLEFKGTKGNFELQYNSWNEVKIVCDRKTVATIDIDDEFYHDYSTDIKNADADLILDSFNTVQSCGLLPSELLKQRNDMREMLKYLHNVGGQGFEIHDRIEKLLESTNP